MVGEHVLAGVGIERQLRGVEVAHRQRATVAPGDELVVLAAIDLEDVGIEPVHRHLHDLLERHVAIDRKGPVRELFREARIQPRRIRVSDGHLRQPLVRLPVPVDLRHGRLGRHDAVRTREQAEEVVEGVVLQIDDEQVLDRDRLGLDLRPGVRPRGEQRGDEKPAREAGRLHPALSRHSPKNRRGEGSCRMSHSPLGSRLASHFWLLVTRFGSEGYRCGVPRLLLPSAGGRWAYPGGSWRDCTPAHGAGRRWPGRWCTRAASI